jgi:glycine/D-amino acid oxidase-like deaminating enzyme
VLVRTAIVGAGIAGTLLAWRLRRSSRLVAVDQYAAAATSSPPADSGGLDATGASGGLVRGFEPDPDACALAGQSLAELYADDALRAGAKYREIGSVYLLASGTDPAAGTELLDRVLPGSVAVLTSDELIRRYPFRGVPAGTVAVTERRAGYLSPARLRDAALGWLAEAGGRIHPEQVVAVDPTAGRPALRLADRTTVRYDAVVLATGAWTPSLLERSGLDTGGLRAKQIQYTVYPARLPGLGAFVDDTTGLYGRPAGSRWFLLGLPCDRWDVDPSRVETDAELVERVAAQARSQLGVPGPDDRPFWTVASFDCYRDPPGLALREVLPGAAVYTFTGGSGGAAKTVLAASRLAAAALLAGRAVESRRARHLGP